MVKLGFDGENLRIARVGERKPDILHLRICLFSTARNDAHLMPCGRHETGMLPHDILHTAHDWRSRVVQ